MMDEKYVMYPGENGSHIDWESTCKEREQEIETLRSFLETCHQNIKMCDDERESLRDTLHEIHSWCAAYPIDVFPEPDFAAVREALEAHGLTIDAVAAASMRHVTEGIQRIIDGEKEL